MKRIVILLIMMIFLTPAYAQVSNRMSPVVKAVNRVQDAVVNIRAETVVERTGPFNDPFFDEFWGYGGTYKNQSLGTGVIIRGDGIVVTNQHVIESSTKITIILQDERSFSASVIGGDSLLDIAILKIENLNSQLPVAPLGISSDLMPGETVIAIGNPFGLSSSVTTGVVSNKRRIMKVENDFDVFIQTDALINPGNSGGPLINLDGEVIGINSAIYADAQGIGFAIPVDTVKRVLPDIMTYKYIRRGYLGFSVYSQGSNDSAEGLYISEVAPGSDAAKLGIKKGDYLTRLDGLPVAGAPSVNYILRTFPPGESISVAFTRGGREFRGTIKLSELPANSGINMLRENYGIEVKQNGGVLAVTSSKYPQYIKAGDILLGVNGVEVKSIAQLDMILSYAAYEDLKLTLSRNRTVFDILLKP